MCEIFRTFRFSRFLHVSFFKSSTFRFAGFSIAFNLPHPVTYTENICKIVNGETGVNLWNNDWVDEPYKGAFPQYKICTEWVRDSYTPVIDIDEISLFNIY